MIHQVREILLEKGKDGEYTLFFKSSFQEYIQIVSTESSAVIIKGDVLRFVEKAEVGHNAVILKFFTDIPLRIKEEEEEEIYIITFVEDYWADCNSLIMGE